MIYLSHDTVTRVDDTRQTADVYLLQSIDLFSHSLCFNFGKDGVFLLEFTTRDLRGAVSTLMPRVSDRLEWTTSVITVGKQIGEGWRSSTGLGKITSPQFVAYQRWLLSWLEENQHYTVIDGGSTVKKFVVDSLGHLCLSATLVPLCLETYTLSYSARERCDPGEAFAIQTWFRKIEQDMPTSLHGSIAWLSRQESIYYHESSVWGSRYWKITTPRFILHSESIVLSPSMSVQIPPPALPSSLFVSGPRTVTTNAQTTAVVGAGFVTTSSSIAPAPLVVPSETSTTLIVIIILVVILIIALFIVVIYLASHHPVLIEQGSVVMTKEPVSHIVVT